MWCIEKMKLVHRVPEAFASGFQAIIQGQGVHSLEYGSVRSHEMVVIVISLRVVLNWVVCICARLFYPFFGGVWSGMFGRDEMTFLFILLDVWDLMMYDVCLISCYVAFRQLSIRSAESHIFL